MPHRLWEESAQDAETPNPGTPTKPPLNAGAARAGHASLDAYNSECQYDSYEPHSKQKWWRRDTKKRERRLIFYVPIQAIPDWRVC